MCYVYLVTKARQSGQKKKLGGSDLATAADIERLLELLISYYEEANHDGSTVRPGDDCTDELMNFLDSECPDMGVHAWYKKTEDEVFRVLAFPDGRPPQWNVSLHPDDTRDSWDLSDEALQAFHADPEMSLLKLQWHQGVGICAMADMIFTSTEVEHSGRFLLCDAVGLGKTCQIFGILALVLTVRMCQSLNRELPPIVGTSLHASRCHP